MTRINTHKMTTQEIVDLTNRLVEVLKFRRDHAISEKIVQFSSGDHVVFEDDEYGEVRGYVSRINERTISVAAYTPKGKWLIDPRYLEKLRPGKVAGRRSAKIVPLFKPRFEV